MMTFPQNIKKIYLITVIPGHTHECIDRYFASAFKQARKKVLQSNTTTNFDEDIDSDSLPELELITTQ